MEQKSIKLLTFNCWGLKYVSKLRKERLQAIANQLATADYDIVALQEVWVEEDWQYIDQMCRAQFPYRRLFKAGILSGPGLAILSKVPIANTFLYRFPINGRPSAFFRGDWFVGKSIAVTIFKPHIEGSRSLAVLNSHMHAPYAPSGDAAYSTHRACQAWDLAKLVKTLKMAGYAVVQVGDLNSKPGSLPYKLFTQEGGVEDSWEVLHGDNCASNEEIALMSPEDQVTKGGITCDSRLNTWRATRQPWEACRLDYALIDAECLIPLKARVEFTELLPAPLSCSHSDHYAYSVELMVGNGKSNKTRYTKEDSEKLYAETLVELQEYIDVTIPFQSTWRKYHFYLSMLLVVLIQIGIAFAAGARAWASVILSIASTLIGMTGLINGLMSLAVRAERRALQEVQLEVKDALRALES